MRYYIALDGCIRRALYNIATDAVEGCTIASISLKKHKRMGRRSLLTHPFVFHRTALLIVIGATTMRSLTQGEQLSIDFTNPIFV